MQRMQLDSSYDKSLEDATNADEIVGETFQVVVSRSGLFLVGSQGVAIENDDGCGRSYRSRCVGGAPVIGHYQLLGVLLGLDQDDVDLGEEEAGQLDEGAQGEREREGDDADGVARRGQIERDEGQPEDEGRVVGEGYVASLVEAFRTLSRLHRVHCADNCRRSKPYLLYAPNYSHSYSYLFI
jgi:hypothetical protein